MSTPPKEGFFNGFKKIFLWRQKMFIENHELSPSIGAINQLLYDEGNDRYKGLFALEVNTPGELEALLAACSSQITNSASRLTLRLFAGPGLGKLSEYLNWNHPVGNFGVSLEAFIPLSEGKCLLYFGGNSPERMAPSNILAAERVATIIARHVAGTKPPRALPPRYSVEMAPPGSYGNLISSDVKRIVSIYQQAYQTYTTTLDYASVEQMVLRGAASIVRNPQGVIASITIGELAEAGNMRICEISDSATAFEERGKSLNGNAKRSVLEFLVREKIDMIYTETRAEQLAVQIDNLRLGMIESGYLPLHCKISSAWDDIGGLTCGFGNLLVFYLPESVRRYYE